jgi:dipeptidyl aminopeptidase/acylaminoacyl peptidase
MRLPSFLGASGRRDFAFAHWLGILALSAFGLPAAAEDLAQELQKVPYQIVFETHRDGNWELYQASADGSDPVNLTRTPGIDELYPHVSPDGTRICFLADEGKGDAKRRNVYVMNRDGSGRQQIATNGRDPCWTASGEGVAYLPGEFDKYTLRDYASRGLAVFDLRTRQLQPHANADLHHLYNVCTTPDGKWFIATVHAGMGFSHAILAIEAQGKRVVDLKIPGCRPDVSADGKHIAWGADDFTLCAAELDFSGPAPKVVGRRDVVKSEKPLEAYHVDWSPDGKYVALTRGTKRKTLGAAPEMIGADAEGWDLWVADAAATNRLLQITRDGKSNKEPDWAPAIVRKR